ncbi:MAG: Lysine exporter protein (LYSE/YGGA) [Clostridia bacterium 41_269]|nr:MAG: Lysine exporter protein (LYSE/YGGA) [Clostridia bacterium 41_269]
MKLPTLFFTALAVGFSGAVVPGPLLTITIDRSLRQGFSAGPLVVLGHGILEIATAVGMFFGLGLFLRQPLVAKFIAVCGGLVLIWMGTGMLKGIKGTAAAYGEGEENRGKKGFLGSSVAAGIMGSLSNPYWFLWWATVGAAFIVESLKSGLVGFAAFFSGHILSDLLWYSAVSLAVTAGRRVFSDSTYKWVTALCGIFMIVIAVYFIWSGISGNINLEG